MAKCKETYIDALNSDNESALHCAIKAVNNAATSQLLKNKANPLMTTGDGSMPLHLACEQGNKQILSNVLLSIFENATNFRITAKNAFEQDPLEILINALKAKDDDKEVFGCIRLLVGTGHGIRERHLDLLKMYSDNPELLTFLQ